MRIVETKLDSSVFEAMAKLLEEHWYELSRNRQLQVLKPDFDRYLRMEAAGYLFSLLAYDGDSLVGYSVNFLIRNLHYADLLFGENDVLFVCKSHRNSQVGSQLIEKTEQLARSRGSQLMVWHAKPGTALENLLPRLGYTEREVWLSKQLSP